MSESDTKGCRRGERPPRRARRVDAARAIEALRKDVLVLTNRIERLQVKLPPKEQM